VCSVIRRLRLGDGVLWQHDGGRNDRRKAALCNICRENVVAVAESALLSVKRDLLVGVSDTTTNGVPAWRQRGGVARHLSKLSGSGSGGGHAAALGRERERQRRAVAASTRAGGSGRWGSARSWWRDVEGVGVDPGVPNAVLVA
jgi:hypothetical protein